MRERYKPVCGVFQLFTSLTFESSAEGFVSLPNRSGSRGSLDAHGNDWVLMLWCVCVAFAVRCYGQGTGA